VSGLEPYATWQVALHARADQPPRHARAPLWSGDARIGSVEPALFPEVLPAASIGAAGLVQPARRGVEEGWEINGDPTATLANVAISLRDAGVAHAWRDEQLAVTDEQGRTLGTVERAVVRPLGITTFAVHLVGLSPDGRHWVQQRSLTKPNDPGLWDTLMGGMIPACDSLAQALERETWEEAGLRLHQLEGLRYSGRVSTRRPSEGRCGYIVEHIDWYRAVLPQGVVPINQDGEVAQFRLMHGDELCAALVRDEFTVEAALILLQARVLPLKTP
jgi:8-oxo-dGTP pyrophosphatase MutT (NUDIX family)